MKRGLGINIKLDKKSQVTVFVIIALIIVLAVAIMFFLKPKPAVSIAPENLDSIKMYIQKCTKDALAEAEPLIILHGGFMDPQASNVHFAVSNNTRIIYLCYTNESEELCINEHPVLSYDIKKQFYEYAKPKIEKCFNDVKNRLSNYGYKEEPMNLSIQIIPNQVTATISKKITYSYNDVAKDISNFGGSIGSPIFNFIVLSSEIIRQETDCNCVLDTCNADISLLNYYNRDFEIGKSPWVGDTEVYYIEETNPESGKKFSFAIRNCVRAI